MRWRTALQRLRLPMTHIAMVEGASAKYLPTEFDQNLKRI